MIRSFADKDSERFAAREFVKRFAGIQQTARVRLRQLDSANTLEDLAIPGLRLKKLEGDRKGQYAIRINDQYRICFRWRATDAYDVEIVDYH